MKKFLGLLLLVSGAVFVPSIEAKNTVGNASGMNAVSQSRQYQTRRYNRRGVRIETRTRNVRRGRAMYRETYQYRYQPNGRVTVRLISRIRIR